MVTPIFDEIIFLSAAQRRRCSYDSLFTKPQLPLKMRNDRRRAVQAYRIRRFSSRHRKKYCFLFSFAHTRTARVSLEKVGRRHHTRQMAAARKHGLRRRPILHFIARSFTHYFATLVQISRI